MAKKPVFDRPVTSTTLAERREAVTRIQGKLKGRRLKKFNALSADQQLAFADKVLKKHGRRNKEGAIDWEGLMKFIQFLFDLLAPFIFPTT